MDEITCNLCNDTEFVYYNKKAPNGREYEYAKPCECMEKKAWQRRFKQSMIPYEFTGANFENYERINPIQDMMYSVSLEYLKLFKCEMVEGSVKKTIPYQNFGLIATFGEQRLKELPVGDRTLVKQQHNNFGIGKTHLQISLAKRLIKDGFNVLVVSDVLFIEELMQAKKMSDDSETYNRLLNNALTCDVLIWDDIGKVNFTEARERMYYTIINERYRMQKPIIFNSNEDRGTLAEKIGYAANSRLLGQAEDYLLETDGPDWRLKKGVTRNVQAM